ncbi:MAG: nucleoside monophosphate kinase, partial [Candidatus Omnitrophica bacterium]|nr:nucleoside monophosphate kinase [Candidatus Omnitrophota bacterium]
KKGFMLDGFPRTMPQGKELDKQIEALSMDLDLVLYFNTPELVTIKRLTGRRVCPKCGFNYHIDNIPPKVAGICDKCNIALIQREDDKEQTIKNRLKIYEEQTSPLLDFYRQKGLLREVRGDHDVKELFDELKELFQKEGLL